MPTQVEETKKPIRGKRGIVKVYQYDPSAEGRRAGRIYDGVRLSAGDNLLTEADVEALSKFPEIAEMIEEGIIRVREPGNTAKHASRRTRRTPARQRSGSMEQTSAGKADEGGAAD